MVTDDPTGKGSSTGVGDGPDVAVTAPTGYILCAYRGGAAARGRAVADRCLDRVCGARTRWVIEILMGNRERIDAGLQRECVIRGAVTPVDCHRVWILGVGIDEGATQ